MDLIRIDNTEVSAWAVRDHGKIKAGPFLERWKAAVCFDLIKELRRGNEPKSQEIWVSEREKRRLA